VIRPQVKQSRHIGWRIAFRRRAHFRAVQPELMFLNAQPSFRALNCSSAAPNSASRLSREPFARVRKSSMHLHCTVRWRARKIGLHVKINEDALSGGESQDIAAKTSRPRLPW